MRAATNHDKVWSMCLVCNKNKNLFKSAFSITYFVTRTALWYVMYTTAYRTFQRQNHNTGNSRLVTISSFKVLSSTHKTILRPTCKWYIRAVYIIWRYDTGNVPLYEGNHGLSSYLMSIWIRFWTNGPNGRRDKTEFSAQLTSLWWANFIVWLIGSNILNIRNTDARNQTPFKVPQFINRYNNLLHKNRMRSESIYRIIRDICLTDVRTYQYNHSLIMHNFSVPNDCLVLLS